MKLLKALEPVTVILAVIVAAWQIASYVSLEKNKLAMEKLQNLDIVIQGLEYQKPIAIKDCVEEKGGYSGNDFRLLLNALDDIFIAYNRDVLDREIIDDSLALGAGRLLIKYHECFEKNIVEGNPYWDDFIEASCGFIKREGFDGEGLEDTKKMCNSLETGCAGSGLKKQSCD
uniref:Uncharacterized protein n=1 Tax=Candidatus Kentrum sp. LPFa TaxID=2126335 RepID=A0A450X936_9GAMM|nr:MAG: hypothetical protein BECKLPF1236A_GA0070988_1002816 [Candidatus Kentron sp. LPFa]VFK25711.1 MAG: hypothetical protein BECKLPF1236C_GA0070990_1002417 [Candidatus Kentron sp. LPFa]